MTADQINALAQKLGYPTVSHISGRVVDPFATGSFNNSAGTRTCINLADPTVWAGDLIAAQELKTEGTDADFGIYAQGVCVEFIGESALSLSPDELVAARESLYIEIQDGIGTRRVRCGVSVAGKPVAADLAAAADEVWYDWSERDYPFDAFAVNLKDIKGCKLITEKSPTLTLPTAIRLHVKGFLMSTSSSASVSCVNEAAKAASQLGAQRVMRLK